jgi:thioesterase domain-containing protein
LNVVALQSDGEGTPFFCVHPIGGHVMCYWDLARHLGADRPFYGLQAQEPAAAGDSYATIEEMAARYVEAVREVRPEGPYLLGGWSMGGVVAYEMARQLLAQGQQVEMLALVDSRLPADGERDWVNDEVAVLSNFAYDLGLSLDGLTLTREEVGRLPEEERLSLVLEECKRAGVLPRDVELPQVARLLRIFKANARALQSYRP